MRWAIIRALGFTWLVMFGAGSRAEAERLYTVSPDPNRLYSFDSATPGLLSPPILITGLGAHENLYGITCRPATRQRYGITRLSIYTINPETGAATFVAALSRELAAAGAGMDFDPVADRLRV